METIISRSVVTTALGRMKRTSTHHIRDGSRNDFDLLLFWTFESAPCSSRTWRVLHVLKMVRNPMESIRPCPELLVLCHPPEAHTAHTTSTCSLDDAERNRVYPFLSWAVTSASSLRSRPPPKGHERLPHVLPIWPNTRVSIRTCPGLLHQRHPRVGRG